MRGEFNSGNLGISAAYEASRLPKEEQREIMEDVPEGENRAKEIAEKVAEAKEQRKAKREEPQDAGGENGCADFL